jgi:hypothetical protein
VQLGISPDAMSLGDAMPSPAKSSTLHGACGVQGPDKSLPASSADAEQAPTRRTMLTRIFDLGSGCCSELAATVPPRRE